MSSCVLLCLVLLCSSSRACLCMLFCILLQQSVLVCMMSGQGNTCLDVQHHRDSDRQGSFSMLKVNMG